jgi:hypothetical protein
MATSGRTYPIFAGTPESAALVVTLLGIGSPTDTDARRRLVHPDPEIVPVTYFSNPDEWDFFDTEPLPRPDAEALKTLSSTRTVRFEENLEDVIVVERWIGEGQKAAMPSHFFRELYNVWLNAPVLDLDAPVYVRWEPRDRTTKTYHVELLEVSVGGAGQLSVAEILAQGGKWEGGAFENPLDGLAALRTGLIPKSVEVRMRIVEEVTA